MTAVGELARLLVRGTRRRHVAELWGLVSTAALYPLGFSSATSAALLRSCVSQDVGVAPIATPVVLVHGYGGNRSNWLPLEVRLADAGFRNLHAMAYDPLASDVPRLAARLVDDCHTAMDDAGSRVVHVIGHSLGGVLLRYAVQCLGLAEQTGVAITIATPHAGAWPARLGRGAVAADLRPGSALLALLDRSCRPTDVRWVSYWSDADLVVPSWSAQLQLPSVGAQNVRIDDEGHVSILRSEALGDSVVDVLLQAERSRTPRAGSVARAA